MTNKCGCRYADYNSEGPQPSCKSCDGTGEVWPHVEGEVEVEKEAFDISEILDDDIRAGKEWWISQIEVPGPGFYRVIVQKIDKKDV